MSTRIINPIETNAELWLRVAEIARVTHYSINAVMDISARVLAPYQAKIVELTRELNHLRVRAAVLERYAQAAEEALSKAADME